MSYAHKMLYSLLAALRTSVAVAVDAITCLILSMPKTGTPKTGMQTSTVQEPANVKRTPEDVDEALKRNPNELNAIADRAGFSILRKQYRRAIHDLEQLLRSDPGNRRARDYLGDAYYRKGDYRAAVREFSRIIGIAPDEAAGFINRGRAHAKLKNYDEAIADYSTAVRLDPADPVAHTNLGIVYRDLNRNADALAQFTRAISLDPRYASAYSERGILYMEKGYNVNGCIDLFAACKFGDCENWEIAVRNKHVPFINELVTAEYHLEPVVGPGSTEEHLVNAAAAMDIARVRDVLRQRPSLNAKPRGVTALHVVAERTYLDIASVLIDEGHNLDVKLDDRLHGHTPLVLAVKNRNIEMVELLLDRGASINLQDGDGLTPLGAAVMPMQRTLPPHNGVIDRNAELVAKLLKRNADPNGRFDLDHDKYKDITPLMAAAMYGVAKIAMEYCDALIAHGADVRAESSNGCSAMQLATQRGNTSLVKRLGKQGAA